MSRVSHAELPRAGEPARDTDHRGKILETAERLFRELGLAKTTVADIARDLRMSPANVYRFFSSKAAIQEGVAANVIGELEQNCIRIAHGPGSAAERLRAIVKYIEAHNRERLLIDRKLHEMVEIALTERWPIVETHIAGMRLLFARVIAEGVAAGEFASCDVELAASILQSACIIHCHPCLMVECDTLPMPSVDQMMDFYLRSLR
jgi:AcrR family transcriptional regulator